MPVFASILLFAASALAAEPFVPASFQVPTTYQGKGYKLVPLGPAIAELDYAAYMSSVDHIRKSTGGNWPTANLTMADQAKDMAGEQKQWDTRASFPYAVLTPDGKKELGCFYLRPSRKKGYDAVATMWVTKEAFDRGFETALYQDMKRWVETAWPFQKVAWPGKAISHEEWKRLEPR